MDHHSCDRSLQAIQRKLDGWELPHLRALAARQARQIERLRAFARWQRVRIGDLERDLSWSESRADMFADALRQVENVQLGLDRAGHLHVVAP